MFSKLKDSKAVENAIMLTPVIFAIAFIPLVVRFSILKTGLSEYSWYSLQNQEGDIFMVSKQTAMFVLDALLILGITQLALKNQLPRLKAFLLLAVYALMIILSTFFSVSQYHSLNGFPGMMESVAVLLGYCGICYYTYGVIKTEQHLKIVMFALFVSVAILCLLGLTQMFKIDIFMSDIGKFFLFSPEHEAYKDSMKQTMGNMVSSTLFNPNYVGIYTCMIIPILLTLAFTVKKKIHLAVYGILLALTTAALIGAGSKTAILTLAPCLIFLLIYFGRKMGKRMIPVVVAIVVLIGGLTVYQGNNSLIATVLNRLSLGYTPDPYFELEDITLNDDNFIVKFRGKELTFSYKITEKNYDMVVVDENKTSIPVMYDEEKDRYVLDDTYYEKLSFQALTADNKQIGYILHCDGTKFSICYSQTDKTYYYLNNFGKYTKLYEAERFDFPLFHLMGGFSGRDYIWQCSVPILKETLFLGSGPDTYAFMFPQYNYVDAAQNGYAKLIVTKPHNTYLQIGIQTGVISLLAYLGFYVLYFIDCIKLYLKRDLNTFAERCGVGIFVGSMCYMFAGLLHDSTIGVSIIFWTLLSVGYVCNRMVKESARLPEDSVVWKKKISAGQVLVSLLVVCTLAVAGYCITDSIIEKPVDGRTTFKTTAINYGNSNSTEPTIPFQASMTTEWNFKDGISASENAFVANIEENKVPISFEVILKSGETVYTSPIIPTGGRIDGILLEKELSKGSYDATVVYHLLDKNNNEVAKAQIEILINILN